MSMYFHRYLQVAAQCPSTHPSIHPPASSPIHPSILLLYHPAIHPPCYIIHPSTQPPNCYITVLVFSLLQLLSPNPPISNYFHPLLLRPQWSVLNPILNLASCPLPLSHPNAPTAITPPTITPLPSNALHPSSHYRLLCRPE